MTKADEIVLETEADNDAALGLYERMGFVREKRLYRFYLNVSCVSPRPKREGKEAIDEWTSFLLFRM